MSECAEKLSTLKDGGLAGSNFHSLHTLRLENDISALEIPLTLEISINIKFSFWRCCMEDQLN